MAVREGTRKDTRVKKLVYLGWTGSIPKRRDRGHPNECTVP